MPIITKKVDEGVHNVDGIVFHYVNSNGVFDLHSDEREKIRVR